MRLTIRHETVYRFETPAAAVIQTLRLTPRNCEGQHVVNWRLDVDRNCRLRAAEDAFGNQTHAFAVEGPIEDLTVLVEGEIETQDAGGVVRGTVERFPPALFLRGTPLTAVDLDIAAFAETVRAEAGADPLDRLNVLLTALHEDMTFNPDATEGGVASAAETFRLKRGACQDLTHVFLTVARHLGVPARYVSGYCRGEDGASRASSGHGWAEAHVPVIGWVGFDPANGLCTTEAHARVAIGLDYLGAAPVRGSRTGGGAETMAVSVVVDDARAVRSYRRS